MITVNITYFNEPHFLDFWVRTAQTLWDKGVDVTVSVCDDGSDRLPAIDTFRKRPPPPNMSLFRVTKNLGFNSHGSRNLLMKETLTPWNVCCDIDRTLDVNTLTKLAANDGLVRGSYYQFKVKSKRERYSLNDYTIHRDDFWSFGGYDEEFVNVHFGDRIMFEAFERELKQVLRDDLTIGMVRNARKVSVGKVELTQYPDDDTLIIPNKSWWGNVDKRERMIDYVTQRYHDREARQAKPVIQFDWVQVF
jgi:hypothetical protein